ncbi:MAG: glycosyltransferase family 2 protein, partial [Thermodesulfobacteriota bacterium]
DSDDTGYMGQFASIRGCSAVTAACMMVKREIFDRVAGFDETYRVGFGDTDFCLRVREMGYANLFTPYATLYHHESATRGQSVESDPHLEDTRHFMSRWQKIIRQGDPFYNPNLPLDRQPQPGERLFL